MAHQQVNTFPICTHAIQQAFKGMPAAVILSAAQELPRTQEGAFFFTKKAYCGNQTACVAGGRKSVQTQPPLFPPLKKSTGPRSASVRRTSSSAWAASDTSPGRAAASGRDAASAESDSCVAKGRKSVQTQPQPFSALKSGSVDAVQGQCQEENGQKGKILSGGRGSARLKPCGAAPCLFCPPASPLV